jgi:hypothetical protein
VNEDSRELSWQEGMPARGRLLCWPCMLVKVALLDAQAIQCGGPYTCCCSGHVPATSTCWAFDACLSLFCLHCPPQIMASPHRGKCVSGTKGGSKQAVGTRQRQARGSSSSGQGGGTPASSRWQRVVESLLRLGQPSGHRGKTKAQ